MIWRCLIPSAADTVFERFKTLFELIRTGLPGENILYVSIKPSPSRARLKEKMEQANLLIKTYISLQQHAAFADVYHKMLNPDGSIMTDIFLEDSLHMNAKGYTIWQKVITSILIKIIQHEKRSGNFYCTGLSERGPGTGLPK